MEVINIEVQTFEAMMRCFEAFSQKEGNLCGNYWGKSLQRWLDNLRIMPGP